MSEVKEYRIDYKGHAYVYANSKEEAEEVFGSECFHGKSEHVIDVSREE